MLHYIDTHKTSGSIHPPSCRKRKVPGLFSPDKKKTQDKSTPTQKPLGQKGHVQMCKHGGKISVFGLPITKLW